MTEPAIQLSLVNGVRLHSAGRDLPLSSRKAKALLAILVLSPEQRRDRRWLRDILWSSSDNAAGSLRGALSELRRAGKAVGVEMLTGGQDEVVLHPNVLQTDVDAILGSLETGPMDARLVAEPLLFGNLLAGNEDLDDVFCEWLYVERANRAAALERRLETALLSDAIDARHRRDLARCLIAHAPLNNFAVLSLMRALDALNDYAGALEAFYELQVQLDEAHEQDPAAELQDLCIQIKTRSNLPEAPVTAPEPAQPSPRPAGQAPEDPMPRIFVELADVGLSPENRHPIARAFFEDLVGSLIRFREWRVIACTGPFETYRSYITTRDCFRLTISAFDAGGSPILSVRFTDAHTEIGIWSERIDAGQSGWWSSQGAIVRRLAVALNVRLTETRLTKIEDRPDANLNIHAAWLRTEALYRQNTPEAWDRADGLLTEIQQKSPSFPHAYISRANMANIRHFFFAGVVPTAKSRKLGLELSTRAIELDPLDGRAQLSFGWANAMNDKWPQAVRAFETAHENNPNDPWTMISSAVGLAFCDQPELSRALSAQAMELELALTPFYWAYEAVIQFLAEDYDACIAACVEGKSAVPDTPAWQIAALANTGRVGEAADVAGTYLENMRANWFGEDQPSTGAITSWLLGCYPFKNRSTWARLNEGLAAAGMTPAAGMEGLV